jgi:hypothetical protein
MENMVSQDMRNILRKLLGRNEPLKKRLILLYEWFQSPYIFYRRRILSDIALIQTRYKEIFGVSPNLDNPRTFNEKLQWKKLYDQNLLYPQCVDKYKVRDFVKERLGEAYLIPLLQVATHPTRLELDKLPDAFIIKVNHGSGQNMLVEDKNTIDWKKVYKKLNKWLRTNHYFSGREWPYKYVKPMITVEALLRDEKGQLPLDYKFHCFKHGTEHEILIQVDVDRFTKHTRNFYDINWQLQPFSLHYPNYHGQLEEPRNFSEMIHAVRKLAQGFDFVRVDLYNVSGKIYFGELTFFPGSGVEKFDPPEYDLIWGEKLELATSSSSMLGV